ncbi:MAG: nucleotidyltransferase domain-containing protein [Gammaproteobacteria bacterium]|nr:nucleotidyltransferase domain-containing protein [Gammaproteobacteria bacterium]MBU1628604.1 nucleotidyltransferase domain-containing protein [Gammaproteobacteria bacterium]MBU2546289.1 nucleotidyltransferase domain-containing protein [Gammaproteobacteria bacterium]
MKRQDVLDLLVRSKRDLQTRFWITTLALFGSTARDRAKKESDVDILMCARGIFANFLATNYCHT